MSGQNPHYGFGKRNARNSTTNILGENESFTGEMETSLEYNYIKIVIKSDVDSALHGIKIQFNNTINTDYFEDEIYLNYLSPNIYTKDIGIKGRYFRVKYTNGATSQTVFRIDTYLSKNGFLNEKHIFRNHRSFDNNSITPLGIDEIYTGTGEDVSNFKSIEVHIESDVVSANNGINIQFSSDNSTWVTNTNIGTLTYSTINSQFYKVYRVEKKFYRVVYTNGSTAQKKFKLVCIMTPYKTEKHEATRVMMDGNSVDAFSRIRISEVSTLAQFKKTNRTEDKILMNEQITGTASKTHNRNESSITLRVEAANSKIIRQSKRYISYQPGKSLMVLMTGVLDSGKSLLSTPESGYNESDTISRIGYFDEYNGYFFKYVANGSGSGDVYIVERSYTSGSVVDNEIHQDYWNIDRLTGFEISDIIFDPTSDTILSFDIQWLGAGSVRVGVVMNNTVYYAHIFTHSGNRTTSYMGTATLPIRYELSSGSSGSNYNATMKEICATVISEGGYTPIGIPRSISLADHDDVPSNFICTVDQTETPIIAVRLKQTNRRATAQILGYSAICTTGGNVLLRLRYYSNYSDDNSNQTPMTKTQSWQSVGDYSFIEFDINDVNSSTEMGFDSNTSNSYLVGTAFFSNNTDTVVDSKRQEIYLTSDIENSTANLTKRDVILLTGQKIGGNGSENICGSLNWSEFD